jgi:hypothetical protein
MSQLNSRKPAAERDRLLALLALRTGFIPLDALAESLRAWAVEKAQPLTDFLRARDQLSAERARLLEALAAEQL